ncbi:MAG: 3-deoxy-manno-octulosonate cytidylyltransferase [Pseudomonadota bacterium]
MSKSLILIPARLSSTRLPGKPLAEIDGIPMICQVINRAREADIGEPVVAADHQDIIDAAINHGAKAVMTDIAHESGSDRIWEAVEKVDPNAEAEIIINLQGDLPSIDGDLIRHSVLPLMDEAVDIATLAAEITEVEERTNPNVVKAVGTPITEDRMRALYFTRASAPHGDGPLYHHIGLYAYRRSALERFVGLPQSPLEKREKLEQLRALENGMRIDIQLVNTIPHGVDTPDDLEQVREYFKGKNDEYQ